MCFFLTFQTLNITRFITWQISWKPNRMWKRSWWHSFKISSHSQSGTVKLHTVLDEANCYRINAESDVLQWSIWTVNCLMYSETKLNNADKAFDLGKLQKLLQVQCEVLHIVVCCYSVTHSCMPYAVWNKIYLYCACRMEAIFDSNRINMFSDSSNNSLFVYFFNRINSIELLVFFASYIPSALCFNGMDFPCDNSFCYGIKAI